MVHWLRIHLVIQRMQVWSLVRELRSHVLRSNYAHAPQLLSPHAATTVCAPQQKIPRDATTKTRCNQGNNCFLKRKISSGCGRGCGLEWGKRGGGEIRKAATTTTKSLQSCPTLCDPVDGSPPGSPVPGILQARILEWVVISFSSAWKWKVKVKSLSRVQLLATPWTVAFQAPPSMGFSRQEYWSGVPLPSPRKAATCQQKPRESWWRSEIQKCHGDGENWMHSSNI